MKAWRDQGAPDAQASEHSEHSEQPTELLPWIRAAKALITLIHFAKPDVTTRQARP
jgi:hypothetical protein